MESKGFSLAQDEDTHQSGRQQIEFFFFFFSGSLMRRNQMIISLTGYYTLKFMHGSYSIVMKCCGVLTKELMTNGPGVG